MGTAGATATDPGATRDQTASLHYCQIHHHPFISPVSLYRPPASFVTCYVAFLCWCCHMFGFCHCPVTLLLAEKLLTPLFHLFISLYDQKQ